LTVPSAAAVAQAAKGERAATAAVVSISYLTARVVQGTEELEVPAAGVAKGATEVAAAMAQIYTMLALSRR